MGVHGDAADLVKRSRSGILCEPGNPESIADAVRQLAESSSDQLAAMGQRGREFYKSELSVSVGVDRFDAVLKQAVQTNTVK
jgi:glycosyltransferase involved in cell wall biosynthesis